MSILLFYCLPSKLIKMSDFDMGSLFVVFIICGALAFGIIAGAEGGVGGYVVIGVIALIVYKVHKWASK